MGIASLIKDISGRSTSVVDHGTSHTLRVLRSSQHHTDGHTAHSTTADKIFYVTNNRNEGRHNILLSIHQDFYIYLIGFNQLLLIFKIILTVTFSSNFHNYYQSLYGTTVQTTTYVKRFLRSVGYAFW
jgi:hypothetical protein